MKTLETQNLNTPCKRLAEALHAACVALEGARQERGNRGQEAGDEGPNWPDNVGRHVALAIAAMPDSVLRAWLLDSRVVGGEEIYRTLKAGAGVRAAGKAVAA